MLSFNIQEYVQEKATLQSNVYEHLNSISELKSQLESVKHLSGSKPSDPSRIEQLMEQLDTVKDTLEGKEVEVSHHINIYLNSD